MPEQKKLLLIGGIIVVMLVLVGVLASKRNNNNAPVQPATGGTSAAVPTPSDSGTRAPLTSSEIQNITVPQVGATPTGTAVAVPVSQTEAAPGVSAQLRKFQIKADNNAFDPSTVIVNKGDTVSIAFTAVDKAYDITIPDYGLKQTAQKGETKTLEFQAVTDGKFVFYCDLCGGASSSVKGSLVVKP